MGWFDANHASTWASMRWKYSCWLINDHDHDPSLASPLLIFILRCTLAPPLIYHLSFVSRNVFFDDPPPERQFERDHRVPSPDNRINWTIAGSEYYIEFDVIRSDIWIINAIACFFSPMLRWRRRRSMQRAREGYEAGKALAGHEHDGRVVISLSIKQQISTRWDNQDPEHRIISVGSN